MTKEVRDWLHEVLFIACGLLSVMFLLWIDSDSLWKLAEEYGNGSNAQFYSLVIGGYALAWGLFTLCMILVMLATWKVAMYTWKSCFRS